jgi:uncharacterized protein (TIGR03083 family)
VTPPYSELVAAVRREGAAILAAVCIDPSVATVTCGNWTLDDLALHVGRVYHRAATAVTERSSEPAQLPPEPESESVQAPDYLADALEELVDALSSAEADSPAWNWSGSDQTAQFWARRMTHESTVHRYDAQRAHGLAQPIDDDLAIDGFDELVDLILPRIVARDSPELPVGSYLFMSSEGQTWSLQLDGSTVTRVEGVKAPDVTVRGTASALLLAAFNRVAWTSLDCEGDVELLAAWSRAIRF